jgi:hypothetical protein
LLLAVFFFTAQSDNGGVAPDSVRRPEHLSNPLYPRDVSIGELGQGDASSVCYSYAKSALRELEQSNKSDKFFKLLPQAEIDGVVKKVSDVAPVRSRLGGGKEGVDGDFSFLFRFIGLQDELTGVIYLRNDEGAWKITDIITDDPRAILEATASEQGWPPYDRFY